MVIEKRALLLATLLSASLCVPVFAADGPEEVTSADGPVAPGQHQVEDHIEGHIAFLKAELKITPAQEADWDKVTDAMRTDVSEFHDASRKYMNRKTEPTALESLTERTEFAELRAQGERRFLEVFKPLYSSLSASQKQSADELFANQD
jgi:hypothetical protein